MASKVEGFPALQFLSNIRQNHALEHATIHVLSARFPQSRFVGRSDTDGFFLYTDLSSDHTVEGVQTALKRLQGGESRLAVHPNCGTNLLTGSILAALASFLILGTSNENKWSDRLDRLPVTVLAILVSFILGQPLGSRVQKNFTTDPNLDESRIVSITTRSVGSRMMYRVRMSHRS